MDIKLTKDQMDEFMTDGWINIEFGNYRIYMEVNPNNSPSYFEIVHSQRGKTLEGYAYSMDELERLKPKRTNDPSWYHNDPLCPSCGTYMIYNFEHCPKCGQKLDWSEYCGDDAK